MDTLTLALLSLLPVLVIVAALSDLTTMRIPNWISGALIVAFFPAALAVGVPAATVGLHVAVALAALLIGMILFALKVFGGGDAKLIAAACLWLGVAGAGPFLLWTAVSGGVLCALLLIGRRVTTGRAFTGPVWVTTLLKGEAGVPYGVAIAAGALMAFPSSALLLGFTTG